MKRSEGLHRFAILVVTLGLLAGTAASVQAGAPAFLTGPSAGDPAEIAREYMERRSTALGVSSADVSELELTDQYTSAHSGATHLYFQQSLDGIAIVGATVNVNVTAEGAIVNVGNRLHANARAAAARSAAAPSAPEVAVRAAADRLGLTVTSPLTVESSTGGADQAGVLSDGGISQQPIPVKLVYQAVDGTLRLAWNVQIYETSSQHYWDVNVDAETGSVLSQVDLVINEAPIASSAQASAASAPPQGAVIRSVEAAGFPAIGVPRSPDGYAAFEIPVESPNHGVQSLVLDPADATASPFGWHDTDGAVGAEFTDTRGNNVFAQEDQNKNNAGGARPSGGASLEFPYFFDPLLAPTAGNNVAASITNLFYWNNIVHDVTYAYGFDEASGNFQANNYGGGGAGGDPVLADALDGSGTNNANFLTLSDGTPPRMQMFIWNDPGFSIDRDSGFDAGIIAHEYAHGISSRLTGGPANVRCLSNQEQMGEGWSDFFGLVLTHQPTDTGSQRRGVGTYVLFEPPTGDGIRPTPYSTDTAVNSYTYANRGNGDISVPHGVGFLWATMLWDMYWALIDVHGYNPNVYEDFSTGGNNLAIQLVMDGMKIQPCSPGFVDGRDAILVADQMLTGGENQCTIWKAFAARGLGFSASQGSTNSRTDGIEAFDLPPSCEGPPVASCNVSTSQSSYVTGETLELMDLQYANDSGAPLPARLRLQLSFGAAFTAELFDSGPALVLPVDLDVQLGPISLFPIPAGLPRGDWEFRCALEDPTTGSVMAEDLAPFEIQ